MTREVFHAVLQAFLKRKPFLAFTLELANGSRLEVNHPEALTLHEHFLVFSSTRGVRSILEYEAVVRFDDTTGSA
jgi:hypothetical protein